MIVMVLVFGLVTVDPPRILLLSFLGYAASGPVSQFLKWRRRTAS